jgi:hypothetical protein
LHEILDLKIIVSILPAFKVPVFLIVPILPSPSFVFEDFVVKLSKKSNKCFPDLSR